MLVWSNVQQSQAANQGFTPTQLTFGIMSAKGVGVPQDFVAAYMSFELAAT
jgi:TPR repeat protein